MIFPLKQIPGKAIPPVHYVGNNLNHFVYTEIKHFVIKDECPLNSL